MKRNSLNVSNASNGQTASSAQSPSTSMWETGNETQTDSIRSTVDQAGILDSRIKTDTKKLNQLKERIKNAGLEQIEGDLFTATVSYGTTTDIPASKMLKWLLDHKKTDLKDVLLTVSITNVRKYLGDLIVEDLGDSKVNESPTLRLKKKD